MSIAHSALTIVLREHAGCLGSFKADQHARLRRLHEITQECEIQAESFMADAKWDEVAAIREETLARINRFAPVLVTSTYYVHTYWKIQRLYKKRLSDDRRNEKRRQQRRKTH